MNAAKNIKKLTAILRHNYIYYMTGFLLLFGLKLFSGRAGSEDLTWILAPTARLVTFLTGIPFTREPGAGYVNHSLRYVIAPSCCGLRFMSVVLAVLLFSFVHRVRKKSLFVCLSVCSAFLYTVLVNGVRIALAIYIPLYFPSLTAPSSPLTPERLHTLIGTVVYFAALLVAYRLTEHLLFKISSVSQRNKQEEHMLFLKCPAPASIRRTAGRLLSPTFWYFFLVLGIPFLNNACQKNREQFCAYASLITCGCLTVLLLPVCGMFAKMFLNFLSRRRWIR